MCSLPGSSRGSREDLIRALQYLQINARSERKKMSEKVWGELREVIQGIFSFLLFIWIMSEARQAFYVNSFA